MAHQSKIDCHIQTRKHQERLKSFPQDDLDYAGDLDTDTAPETVRAISDVGTRRLLQSLGIRNTEHPESQPFPQQDDYDPDPPSFDWQAYQDDMEYSTAADDDNLSRLSQHLQSFLNDDNGALMEISSDSESDFEPAVMENGSEASGQYLWLILYSSLPLFR